MPEEIERRRNKLKNHEMIELNVPDIGDTDSIELVKWHKKRGELFKEGDELCEMVSDKATFSLEAPQGGKLVEIVIPERSKVRVGQLVGKAIIS